MYLLVVLGIVALYGFAYAGPSAELAGKKVFIDAKCGVCHSVDKAGIELKTKKKNIPDLSTVGATVKPEVLKKYIMKQEKINDKNHPTAFKGSDEDLTKLVQWLSSLKK